MKKVLVAIVTFFTLIPGSLALPVAAVMASEETPAAASDAVSVDMNSEPQVITKVEFEEGDTLIARRGPRVVFTEREGATLNVNR